MTDDPVDRARRLAEDLRARGHADASAQLQGAAARPPHDGLLEGLREACQTILTAIEALDPSAFAAIEELRLDVDRRLDTGHTSG